MFISPIGKVFIFGSWLRSQAPKDLDLLYVYNERVCSPQRAIKVRHTLIDCGVRLGLPPVHVVVLSEAESVQCRFIESEDATPVQKWADEHCDGSLQRLIDEVVTHL